MDEHGWVVCTSCGASLQHTRFPNLNKPNHPDCFTCKDCLKGSKMQQKKPSFIRRLLRFIWD